MIALQPDPRIAVVIPCFNEARNIGPLVQAVRPLVPVVFVVDDGSTDSTFESAKAAGANPIRQPVNRGKGFALRTGLRHADVAGFEFAILMDGDGQHDPADLPRFVEAAQSGDADLVIGNRMNEAGRMPWVRRGVNRWMSRRLSRRAGRELPDTQCGFRLVRLSALREVPLQAERFEIESEMLMSFLNAGLRVRFVPVCTIYKTGQSKIHPVRDTIRWFRWWWRQKQR